VTDDPSTTEDTFLRGRLRLAQPRRGARVTMDPLLVADFAARHARRGKLGRVLDAGCGTGVIGLALLIADPGARVTGLEIVPSLAALARENAARNDLPMTIVDGDLADPRALPLAPGSFDLVIANPPYTAAGRGRVPPRADRAAARAETACTLADVVELARRLLAPSGRLVVIVPAGRLGELAAALAAARLDLQIVRAVHSVADEPARRVLVQAGRGRAGDTQLEPPLVVHGADRHAYTPEAARILGDG
jgi:tRNA1(Val) A37 N6-methylase TrmN6